MTSQCNKPASHSLAGRAPGRYTRGMLLAPAPSLVYVVGLPAGLMVCVGVIGAVAWVLIGRISRG
jgi:hypothetical protein